MCSRKCSDTHRSNILTLTNNIEYIKNKILNNIVTKTFPYDCWEYQSNRKRGYGSITYKGKSINTHVASYMIFKGDIPKGLVVRHVVCDNPKCVNPNHLEIGTHQDNKNDCVSKNRQSKGERNFSKLTEDQVKEIRRLYALNDPNKHRKEYSIVKLSKMFGVCKSQIDNIISNVSWKHVSE